MTSENKTSDVKITGETKTEGKTVVGQMLAPYREQRIKYIKKLKAESKNPYPHKFSVTHTFGEIIVKYKDI